MYNFSSFVNVSKLFDHEDKIRNSMKINNESKKICSQWTIRNSLAYIIQLSRLSVITFLDRLLGRCKTRSNGLTYVCKWECKWANSTRSLCVQALTRSLEICIVAWKTLERRARRALIVRFKGQFRGKESIAEGGLPFNSCEFFFSPPFEETLRRKHASSSFHFHLTTEL